MPSKRRPVFLNLLQFRFPIPAIMSIVHRGSGAVMVLSIPLFVYLLDLSLRGEAGFTEAAGLLQSGPVRLVLFFYLWGVIHHLLAGVRYLLLDFDIGVDREAGTRSAWAVLVAAPVLTVLLGVML
jgi:succinate dehydrogenase / fumarate reductase cytochrome b subunit